MVVSGETAAKSRCSSKSRTSRSSRTTRASRTSSSRKKREREWSCCPCPLTAALPGLFKGGGGEGVEWPAPARFYCCRADLVADMAKERGKQQLNNNDSREMQQDNEDNDVDDLDDEWALDEVAEEALPDATFREVFDRSHSEDPDHRWEVKEPDLPYVEDLPHQLDVGRAIVLAGTVLPDAVGFAVNLTCGPGEVPDIAFHFNPRLDRHYVARNTRIKKHWGVEEGAALGGSPFECSQSFIIHILVTATGFKVAVNHMHFCNFQFRMPLSKVCRLEVHGDVVISSIKHTRLEVYPERSLEALPEHTFCSIPTDHAVPWSCDTPDRENLFIGRFKPNLCSGVEISIKGRIKLLPQSFYVNLQQGCQLWPHPNIHFHLNPRFAAEDSEHIVVINTWMRGSWGSEQRYTRCRFRPGESFSIVIYVEEQRYRVMVNGMQQGAMFHRAPPSLVDTLVVRGDVYVTQVGISKSAPPVQRLESPGSAYGSFCGSLVDFPTETNRQNAPTPEIQPSESQPAYQANHSVSPKDDKDNCWVDSSAAGGVQQEEPSTSWPNNSKDRVNESSATSDDYAAISSSVVSEQNETDLGEKNVTFDESPGVESDMSYPLPKAALSVLLMAVLYGGYLLRR